LLARRRNNAACLPAFGRHTSKLALSSFGFSQLFAPAFVSAEEEENGERREKTRVAVFGAGIKLLA